MLKEEEVIETFWKLLVEEAETEIEKVCIGPYAGLNSLRNRALDRENIVPKEKTGTLISPSEAETYLSYPFDSKYGDLRCHSVVVWSKTRVVFVVQYDGSARIESVFRDPCPNSATIFGE